jgi:hypothetical protein
MSKRPAAPELLTLRSAVVLALTSIASVSAGVLALMSSNSLPHALLFAGGTALAVIGVLDQVIARNDYE